MQKVRHQYFRWTPRTAKITFMYVVVVPTLVGYIAYKTDVSSTILMAATWEEATTDWCRDSLISGQSGRATLSTNDEGIWVEGLRACTYMDSVWNRAYFDPLGADIMLS